MVTVQKYLEIEIVVTPPKDIGGQFGGRMSCKCHALRAVCEGNLVRSVQETRNSVFCASSRENFIFLSKNFY